MKKCILVYEDNSEILDLCRMILEGPDRRVEMKMRCDDIIADIEQFEPDIVLMDLWIPEMGGEKAVHLMKTNPSAKHIPVILFSAHPEIEQVSKKVKAEGYLNKPFDITHLKGIIEKNIL
jgi:CheY-like chemotaxis protein